MQTAGRLWVSLAPGETPTSDGALTVPLEGSKLAANVGTSVLPSGVVAPQTKKVRPPLVTAKLLPP